MRFHPGNNQCEKYLMRKAVELFGNNLLPKSVLWRTKEAFSDARIGTPIPAMSIINAEVVYDIEQSEDKKKDYQKQLIGPPNR